MEVGKVFKVNFHFNLTQKVKRVLDNVKMDLEEEIFDEELDLKEGVLDAVVIDKRQTKTLFLRRPKYFATLKIVDKRVSPLTLPEFEVCSHYYNAFVVGGLQHIKAYSANGKDWYFSSDINEWIKIDKGNDNFD